ncbi:MAG: DUF721 domain-containing protein [Bdellovibrionales bacterium]|nr:DUF721 domain-containing protein [Bdellovibrionales bacterium]
MKFRGMAFDSLLEIFRKIQKENPSIGKKIQEAEAFGRWEEAVGKMIAKHAHPVRVEQGKLWIEVDHPIWQNELSLQKNRILEVLNQKQKDRTITDLVFVQPRQPKSRT